MFPCTATFPLDVVNLHLGGWLLAMLTKINWLGERGESRLPATQGLIVCEAFFCCDLIYFVVASYLLM
jgi:hypothetical protein